MSSHNGCICQHAAIFNHTPDDSAFFVGVGAGNVWDECQEGSPKQGASFD